MNYYERHLGDYAKDTAHLSMLEHGAYGLLLDRYYATEQGIPADQAHRVTRARTREEREAVDTVLNEFFTLTEGVWLKGRVEAEIAKAQTKIKAAQSNGKRGGRPKSGPDGDENGNPEQTQQKPTGLSLGSKTETQKKALQTPDTRHQKKLREAEGVQPGLARFNRATRKCPPDFEVTDLMRSWAERESPGVDVERETAKFLDHTYSRAISDWAGAWRNWMRKAVEVRSTHTRSPINRQAAIEAENTRVAREWVAQNQGILQ